MDPTQQVSPAPSDSRFSMKYGGSSFGARKILVGALTLLGLMIVYTWITSPMILTVTGTGQVSAPAESATLSFSVAGSDATPTGATAIAKAKAAAIRSILLSSGIAESDIAESQARVVPASLVSQGASGYQAVITMGAKTVHVGDTGSLVSNLYAAGATLVSQPVVGVDNKDELQQEAFQLALKDAKRQASQIGLRNLKFIRKIVAVSQVDSPATSTVTSKADTLTATDQAAPSDVFNFATAVSVTYKMW